jgi:hypothetical protein
MSLTCHLPSHCVVVHRARAKPCAGGSAMGPGCGRGPCRVWGWRDDEDITPTGTNDTPQDDIQGPITRACAR